MVDRRGRLCFAPNLPQAHGVDWTELIGDRLPGRRILIENDANFAVLAEHRLGAARGHDDVVMVTLGTGHRGRHRQSTAGCRSVRRASPARSATWWSTPPGPPAPAGGGAAGSASRRAPGWASSPARRRWPGRLGEVVRLAGGDPESVRGEDVSAAAAAGDPAARRVIERSGGGSGSGWPTWPACSIRSASCWAAGWCGRATSCVDAARATFAELVEGGDRRPPVVIVPAAFGERSGAVGAALAARQGGLW